MPESLWVQKCWIQVLMLSVRIAMVPVIICMSLQEEYDVNLKTRGLLNDNPIANNVEDIAM